VEPIIRKFKIQTLKAQWVLRQYICVALAKEFETGTSTANVKWSLVDRWDDTLKESQVLQLMLDLLESRERNGVAAR
jgi:hypothetical protein